MYAPSLVLLVGARSTLLVVNRATLLSDLIARVCGARFLRAHQLEE